MVFPSGVQGEKAVDRKAFEKIFLLPLSHGGFMKKILIIDDDENIRLLCREELIEEGYEVLVAANDTEAREQIRKDPPDVITLDIRMPGMDGIELLETLKEEHAEIPVIMCSGYPSYKQDFRVWAADAYVVKSADLTELKMTIKEVLDHNRPVRAETVQVSGFRNVRHDFGPHLIM